MNKCSNDNLFGGAIECRNKKKRHTSPLLILPHMPAAIAVMSTRIITTNVDAVTSTNITTMNVDAVMSTNITTMNADVVMSTNIITTNVGVVTTMNITTTTIMMPENLLPCL